MHSETEQLLSSSSQHDSLLSSSPLFERSISNYADYQGAKKHSVNSHFTSTGIVADHSGEDCACRDIECRGICWMRYTLYCMTVSKNIPV